MPLKFSALALATFMCLPAALMAQSLGDVAKKEGERRQTVKPAAKVLTNKDLPAVPPPSAGGGADPGVAAAPADPAPKADGPAAGDRPGQEPAAADDASKKPDGTKDESYWSGRMKGLRDELARDRLFAEALQSRINALTTDFVNRDDPAQRALIGQGRQEAIDELGRVQKSIVTRGKAIADLEEEARRAGVPAGWLRE
jgi:hypothetical protein